LLTAIQTSLKDSPARLIYPWSPLELNWHASVSSRTTEAALEAFMRFGTFRHALCMGLLATCCQASLAADESSTPPPAPKASVKRDCADTKGATKKECEKVAAKIEAQAADPAAHPATDEGQSSADYVHHSSPAMRTPAEVAKDKAEAKSDKKPPSTKPK
jgi:hypothetical protein